LSASRDSTKKGIFVEGNVDAVRISAELRIIGKTWASLAVVIGRSLSAVVLSWNPINVPDAERITGLAYGEVEMVGSTESERRSNTI
jgi:hypothetical protein